MEIKIQIDVLVELRDAAEYLRQVDIMQPAVDFEVCEYARARVERAVESVNFFIREQGASK